MCWLIFQHNMSVNVSFAFFIWMIQKCHQHVLDTCFLGALWYPKCCYLLHAFANALWIRYCVCKLTAFIPGLFLGPKLRPSGSIPSVVYIGVRSYTPIPPGAAADAALS